MSAGKDMRFLAGGVGTCSAVLFAALLVVDGISIPANLLRGDFAALDALVGVWAGMLYGSVRAVRWSRRG